ncbi:MAG TPA: GNAT family N-acetyltransferase [Symbiobacteriaceae bacterium]|nr:GNAT family N-acetyltransferase [Symbiobacteriaceae bacterium]
MVETERLELVPAPLEMVEAVAAGRRGAVAFPAVIPAEWPGPDLRDFLPTYARILAEDPEGACWGVWVMIEKASRTVIGDIGFKGAPDEHGRVEIGYGVLPAWRRQGFAVEAASGLVRWALADPDVRAIDAECLADNAPSARVLEKIGMRCLGRQGEMLKWKLTR